MLNEKVNVEVLEMDSLREDNIMCQKRKCHNCKKVYESFMDEDNVWEDFFCSEECEDSYCLKEIENLKCEKSNLVFLK